MIKEITTFIETRVNSPLAVPVPVALAIDTNLFAGHRPLGVVPDPDDCDVVLESSGGTPFSDLPERADVMFQVLSRAKTYMTARARAWVIYNAIYGDWTLGTGSWRLPLIDGESISDCEAIANWTGTARSIDAIDYKEGAGSLKDDVVFPAVIAAWYSTQYIDPAGTWDWSNRDYILFWLQSNRGESKFTNAIFRIWEGANWRYWDLTFWGRPRDATVLPVIPAKGEWTAQKLLLSKGKAESGTPPDLTKIDRIEVTFEAKDTTAFYKKIDNVRVITEEYEIMAVEPLVTPQYIGQDEKGRYEFSTNYIFKTKKF